MGSNEIGSVALVFVQISSTYNHVHALILEILTSLAISLDALAVWKGMASSRKSKRADLIWSQDVL